MTITSKTILRIYETYRKTYTVSTDTRNITKGSVFFALKGANFNGNTFANEALEKGAALAIVDEAAFAVNQKTILVKDALKTLQNLALYHRKEMKLPIISLTGSNGKTTTKELMTRVLKKKYKAHATKGNLNNHIGVPLTLLSILPEHEIAIIEMGANHQKEIEALCKIAQPDYGYITNFGKAHLEGFGGVKGVIKGKSELYHYLRENHKKVFINADDPVQVAKSKEIEHYSFGRKNADVVIKPSEEASGFASVVYKDSSIKSNLTGAYNYANISAAITIGIYFGISLAKIKDAIESYVPKNNRLQVIEKGTKHILLDAYNANPSSMEAALVTFAKTKGKKTVILGDMFELGNYSTKEHQKVAEMAFDLCFEQIILVGEAFYKTKKPALRFSSTDILITYLKKNPTFKHILIKGSRGMKLEKILDYL